MKVLFCVYNMKPDLYLPKLKSIFPKIFLNEK